MSITPAAAKKLAVAYNAYLSADDNIGVCVWAEILLDAQSKTGVEMIRTTHLEIAIRNAKRAP